MKRTVLIDHVQRLELDAKLTNERRMVDRDPDGKEVASSLDGL